MAHDRSTSITEHLLQAALRYVECQNFDALRGLLQDEIAVATARSARDGMGAIHAAAETGSVELLTLLLEFGAQPNMVEGPLRDQSDDSEIEPGYVPLHYASRSGSLEAVELLLSHGANPKARTTWAHTPLHEARTGPIVEALLRSGADPDAVSYERYFDEETLGWYFAVTRLFGAAIQGDIGMTRLLVERGATVDFADHVTGRTALHYAAACGRAEAAQALLDMGADPNPVGSWIDYGHEIRKTPLHYAAVGGHEDVVRVLLAAGADSTLTSGPRGQSLRRLAEEAGHKTVAALLNED